jgi:hypothetical protein
MSAAQDSEIGSLINLVKPTPRANPNGVPVPKKAKTATQSKTSTSRGKAVPPKSR